MRYVAFIFIMSIAFPAFSQISISGAEKIVEEYNSAKKDTFTYFHIADSNLFLYKLPKKFEKPNKWKEAETKRITRSFYSNKYPENYTLMDALNSLTYTKEFGLVISAKTWCIDHYEVVFPYLVGMLSNKTKVGLENTADLIIWDRIATGDLKFYGHGGGMEEDLFTVAGRASWILNELTGEDFATVHANLTEAQAQEFKQMWIEYIQRNSR